ncbi:DMT family transporter [Thermomicrobium sp. CFH 73360]|uniref:EamA family transporter n=1 Tax=Thermomicrobium sp. CFH 73360 TaxID=2951987 RepID=UPI0020769DA1|nr:DMT family transporter [Thermomicrobium sp. CFH 73360]
MTVPPQVLAKASRFGGLDPIGAVAVLLSALGFGTLATLTKVAYAEGVSVPALILWRFGFSALLVFLTLPLEWWRRGSLVGTQPWTRHRMLLVLLAVACFTGNTTLYLVALQRISVSTAAILFYVYPLLVVGFRLLGWREVPSIRQLIAIVAALSGTAITLGWRWGGIDPFGAIMMILSASLYAGYIVLAHRGFRDASPVAVTACIFSATTLFALLFVWSSTESLMITLPALAPVLGIVVFATFLPVQLFLIGTVRLGPTPAAILGTFEPVASVLVAVLTLGERLSGAQLVGGLLVLTAAILVRGEEGRRLE